MSDAMTYSQLMRRWEARGKELRTLKKENKAWERLAQNHGAKIIDLKAENKRLRDEILRENTKFGQVERDDLVG